MLMLLICSYSTMVEGLSTELITYSAIFSAMRQSPSFLIVQSMEEMLSRFLRCQEQDVLNMLDEDNDDGGHSLSLADMCDFLTWFPCFSHIVVVRYSDSVLQEYQKSCRDLAWALILRQGDGRMCFSPKSFSYYTVGVLTSSIGVRVRRFFGFFFFGGGAVGRGVVWGVVWCSVGGVYGWVCADFFAFVLGGQQVSSM